MRGGAESVGKCGERCGEVCWGMVKARSNVGRGMGMLGEVWGNWRKVWGSMLRCRRRWGKVWEGVVMWGEVRGSVENVEKIVGKCVGVWGEVGEDKRRGLGCVGGRCQVSVGV